MIMFLFVYVYLLVIHSLTSCLKTMNFMGDIGVTPKPCLNLIASPSPITSTTSEHARVTDQPKSVSFVAIKRPRSSHSNQLQSSHFLTDFDNFLTVGTNIPVKCVIMQDGLPIQITYLWSHTCTCMMYYTQAAYNVSCVQYTTQHSPT